MANLFGFNSYLNSNFFSSMLGTGSSNMFGSLYSSLGDYASIKSGSYRTLVKAYYAQQAEDVDSTSSKKSTSTNSSVLDKSTTDANTKKLAEVKNKADSMKDSADVLMERGTDSLFQKVDVKNEEDGTVTKQYDTDKIYKAVKDFVDDYNSLMSEATKSTNASILRKGVGMVTDMAVYEKSLKDIGITINDDNTLSIDEETFKKSDMLDVKSLFNGSVSISSKMYQKASEIYNVSTNAMSSNSLYNSNAQYSNSLTGSLYNGIF